MQTILERPGPSLVNLCGARWRDHHVARPDTEALLAELEGEGPCLHHPGLVVGVAVQARAWPGSLLSKISEIIAPWSAP
ncbi:MAG TPA: hypothetical protein VEF89_28175 [Solirubrobacteraceae bacterium]|nr:hypothetical protein [Solirubrobacteraceae bacterium]